MTTQFTFLKGWCGIFDDMHQNLPGTCLFPNKGFYYPFNVVELYLLVEYSVVLLFTLLSNRLHNELTLMIFVRDEIMPSSLPNGVVKITVLAVIEIFVPKTCPNRLLLLSFLKCFAIATHVTKC